MSAYVIDQPDITAIPVRGTDAAFPHSPDLLYWPELCRAYH